MSNMKMLEQPALVLNRNWTPIQTTTVKEAIGLVAKGSAFIIDTESYRTYDLYTWNDLSQAKEVMENGLIRSQRLAIVAPEVILLRDYKGLGERSVVFSRRNLFKRDRFTCQYCGKQPRVDELTIDHVMPKSRGGASSWTNCVLACVECNKTKADRTPREAKMKLRKAPVKPTWKSLAQIPPNMRRESWEKFVSRAYWDVELEP